MARSPRGALTMVLIALAGGVACGGSGGGGGGGTGNNPTVTIAKTATQSGDAQTGTVGADLTLPLRVLVMEDGNPKAGEDVTWSIVSGGGSVTTTATTDASGIATTTWTLGTGAGVQSAKATLAGATGSPVTFGATATPGPPASVSKSSGDAQTAIRSGPFPSPVTVKVTDQFGNVLSGVTVDFAGTGSVTPVSATTTTSAAGLASTNTLGGASAGAGTVVGSVVGVGGTATFNLTVANAIREVTVGPGIAFRSSRNNSQNAAVDTIPSGEGVLWRWTGGSHSVESTGSPTFTSSSISSAAGNIYTLVFGAAGTYQYDCAVHGTGMTGRVVVQ